MTEERRFSPLLPNRGEGFQATRSTGDNLHLNGALAPQTSTRAGYP